VKTNIFQLVILILFGAFIIGGVLFFVVFKGSSNAVANAGSVTIWGTIPNGEISSALSTIQRKTSGLAGVTYTEKDPATYDSDILNAFATGNGPDLILLDQDQLISYSKRIILIPFSSYSERTFRDTFFDEAGLLVFPSGIAGVPFAYDPIVMYWNRDMFASAGIVNPPAYWDEMLTDVPKLTETNDNNDVLKSGLAFGESTNVDHFKDILSLLMLQAGSPITTVGSGGDVSLSLESNTENNGQYPGDAALQFFTQFSNPIKTVYSWNRALPDARQEFLSGDLAIYFGYASEYKDLKAANPNLNFDLAAVPQSRTASHRSSTGKMTFFAIPKLSKNQNGAFIAALGLTTAEAEGLFIVDSKLPPVRRDLLSETPDDAYQSVLYDSAIIAHGWLDPNPTASTAIFARMIDEVTSGAKQVSSAVSEADAALAQLFK
jgi:ABC-type glycerol-3-phosphate transport system substrate-binding protein